MGPSARAWVAHLEMLVDRVSLVEANYGAEASALLRHCLKDLTVKLCQPSNLFLLS